MADRAVVILLNVCVIGLVLIDRRGVLAYTNHTFSADIIKQVICDFDTDVCLWRQSSNDSFDWTQQDGETSSSGTGPHADHTGNNGKYMFIETSAPRQLGETAKLTSYDVDPWNSSNFCFSFWYYMFGDHIGSLSVVLKTDKYMKKYETLWSKTGPQGEKWLNAKVPIVPPGPLNIIIEGSVGDGYLGDIAIDDLSLTYGDCTT